MITASDHKKNQALNGGVGPHRSRYSAGDAAGRYFGASKNKGFSGDV